MSEKKTGSDIVVREEDNTPTVRKLVNMRYHNLSHVSDYFPIILENGMEVPGVIARCSRCNKEIMKAMFRGELRHVPENCFRVTGIGWCLECDVLSPYLFHIMPYGPTFFIQNMNQRGWPECYEHKVLPFEKPKKKRKKEKNISAEVLTCSS